MSELNARIFKFRRLADFTQTDMAEKLNIKCSTYSQMERKGIISADRLFQMAKIFGVTPCHLYYGEEPCKKEKPLIFPPVDGGTPKHLNQPEPLKPEKEIFIVTKKEENLIKLLRNLSKPNYAKTINFIEEVYPEDKNKKCN